MKEEKTYSVLQKICHALMWIVLAAFVVMYFTVPEAFDRIRDFMENLTI